MSVPFYYNYYCAFAAKQPWQLGFRLLGDQGEVMLVFFLDRIGRWGAQEQQRNREVKLTPHRAQKKWGCGREVGRPVAWVGAFLAKMGSNSGVGGHAASR